MQESEAAVTNQNEDTYHNPRRLDAISSQAKGISWALLVLAVAILVLNLISAYQQYPQYGISGILPSLLNSFVLPLICTFFFIFLRAIAEGIYILMDIEENTRQVN